MSQKLSEALVAILYAWCVLVVALVAVLVIIFVARGAINLWRRLRGLPQLPEPGGDKANEKEQE